MKILLLLLGGLKIIGIILLIILALILLAIAIVLFVPVRYKGEFSLYDSWWVYGRVSWLLGLVSCTFEYKDKEADIRLRVIKKISLDGKDTDDEETEPLKEKTTYKPQLARTDEGSKVDKEAKEGQPKEEKVQPKKAEPKKNKKDVKKKVKKPKPEKPQGMSLKDKLQALYNHPLRKKVFVTVKDRIIKVIKHILPKKYHVEMVIGFDDPSKTGYMMALYGMSRALINPKKKNTCTLEGNFTEAVVLGKGHFKGRIYLFYLLYQIIGMLLNKQVREYVKFARKTLNR